MGVSAFCLKSPEKGRSCFGRIFVKLYGRNNIRCNTQDSEIWTPWVGKRSGGGKDSEIWTPWVGKRNGVGSDLNEQEDMGEYDSLDENTWVYPLPQNI